MTLRSFAILFAGFIFGASPTNPAHQQSNTKDRRPPDPISRAICGPLDHMSPAQFEILLQTIRTAWL